VAGNKEILGQLYEAINGGNLDHVDEIVGDDFVEHEEFPGFPPTREGVKQLFAAAREAFADFRMDAQQYVEEGDLVVAWVQMTGTQRGEFMGIPASGNAIELSLADMVRVRDGKIVEHWGVSDTLLMMQQLGAIPAPPG
jgi:steroid delta-isomerase-like uncharacterized protein